MSRTLCLQQMEENFLNKKQDQTSTNKQLTSVLVQQDQEKEPGKEKQQAKTQAHNGKWYY